MPWTPVAPPLMADEDANELGKWAFQQMQQLAAQFEAPDVVSHNVLHVAPDKPREGQIVVADGTDWNPGSGAGQYMYIGGAWVIQRSGPEPNTYGTITDGTTPAPADTAGDTFKLRAAAGLKVVTQNDDATHGDNALFSYDFGALSSVAPVLADKLPFGDTSNSDAAARTTIQILLDLIGALTTEASPDFAADFLALYDNSGAVAKKVSLSNFSTRQLISSTTLSSTGVNITVPAGYKDLQLRLIKGDMTNAADFRIRFSENGGSTFLNQDVALFSDSFSNQTSANNNPQFQPYNDSGALFWGVMDLFNYLSSSDKFTAEQYIVQNAGGNTRPAAGGRVIASTAAINFININAAAGTFTGTVELWGII